MGIDEAVLQTIRKIKTNGVQSLVVNQLELEDITPERLGWSGDDLHLKAILEEYKKMPNGLADYLIVRAPNHFPISKGAIDYSREEGYGWLWMLNTHSQLQSLGIGSHLIRSLEKRILKKGKNIMLGVETTNLKAIALYKKLGYKHDSNSFESWEEYDDQGNIYTYRASIKIMTKNIYTSAS